MCMYLCVWVQVFTKPRRGCQILCSIYLYVTALLYLVTWCSLGLPILLLMTGFPTSLKLNGIPLNTKNTFFYPFMSRKIFKLIVYLGKCEQWANNEQKTSPRHIHPTVLGYISNNGIIALWILLLTVLGVSVFPIMAVPTYILTNGASISFSITSASTWYSWSETVHCAFDLHVPDNLWCQTSFHIFTSYLCFLWRKCIFRSLKNFNNSCLKVHFSVLGIQEF